LKRVEAIPDTDGPVPAPKPFHFYRTAQIFDGQEQKLVSWIMSNLLKPTTKRENPGSVVCKHFDRKWLIAAVAAVQEHAVQKERSNWIEFCINSGRFLPVGKVYSVFIKPITFVKRQTIPRDGGLQMSAFRQNSISSTKRKSSIIMTKDCS